MLDRARLAQALSRRPLADWVLFERDQDLRVVAHGRTRTEQRTRWRLVAHADTPAGRGSARLALDGSDGDADAIADRAVGQANAAVGAAWESAPASAPARVELADPAFATGDDFDAVAERLVAPNAIAVPGGAHAFARARLLREHVSVITKQGFHGEWAATLARVDLDVVAGFGAAARSRAIAREARRLDALDLDGAVAAALADLALAGRAPDRRAAPGPCAVVLAADALVPDNLDLDGVGGLGGLGVWSAFAAQADAVLARAGLARYHERSPIARGADQIAEPLSIASDGALAFGVRSAPVGDDGEAVRRFALIERGVAAGLGLAPREAALLGRDPNGGVRNLAVAPGTWDGVIDASARTIEVRRLRGLAIDPYTGDASLEISFAIEHGPGIAADGAPLTAGTLRLDLIDALARARRSAATFRRGPYDGPARVWIERAELI